ncbi:MAG: hypothetical protein K1X83_11530, partial [Oligoflexia bacterium]|nr:hypothetical protein [Oligoflexia bacterium]
PERFEQAAAEQPRGDRGISGRAVLGRQGAPLHFFAASGPDSRPERFEQAAAEQPRGDRGISGRAVLGRQGAPLHFFAASGPDSRLLLSLRAKRSNPYHFAWSCVDPDERGEGDPLPIKVM